MMTNQLRSYETQVLLLGWCNDFPKVDPVNLFEIFSGAANTTKWWWLVCTYKFIRSSMIWFYLSDPLTHHDLGTNVASNVPPSISHTAKPSRRVIRWISTSHRGFCTLASVVVQINIYIQCIYIYRENLAWSWLFYEPAMFIYEAMSLRHHAGVTQCVESDGS